MAAFDFGILPYWPMVEVLEKMSLKTLSRMCKTSYGINAIVEKNRRIKACSDVPSILKISVNAEENEVVYEVAFKHLKNDFSSLSYDLRRIPEKRFQKIDTPIEQLSIVKFDYVFMDFANNSVQESVIEALLGQLERLRLVTDSLCIHTSKSTTSIVKDVIQKIKFNNFIFEGPCRASDVEGWAIQHCEQLFIPGLRDVPKRLSAILNGVSKASLYFNSPNGVPEMIKSFLQEIKEDGSAVRKLKALSVFAPNLGELNGMEDLKKIYYTYDFRNRTNSFSISKFTFDGGFTYVGVAEGNYDFQFKEEECDDDILGFLRN